MIKLLDEKGLTTVWAAIKNTFTSKSDADGKYAKTADVNTALAKKVDAVSGKGLSTNDFTAAYKSKLDGIATGANNYTLPTASNTTLGGIKVSINKPGTEWPICVDNNGLAYTAILGLEKNDDNSIFSVNLGDSYANTTYGTSSIEVSPLESEKSIELTYPTTSGTLALTSDCCGFVMDGGIVNNNISFNGYKQNVLISVSGNYNISNWYNSSPVGSVIDIYPYAEINGTIVADNKYIFKMIGTSSSGLAQIVTKKSINLSSDHYIRLIHISDGVYVCVSALVY